MLDHPLVAQLAGRADVVVHLAAAVGVKLIVEQPLQSLLTNIRGTEIVLDAAAMGGCRVLVASTSEIYGKNATGPLVEDSDRILGSPFVARWTYSEAKAVDEILAHAYWKERGTEAIVVRFFNCVGPRQTGAYGMVIPRSFARRSGARTSRSTARASNGAASATCRTPSRRWSRCWTIPTAPAIPSTSAR